MTITSAAYRGSGLITRPRSNATSDSATLLAKSLEEVRRHLLTSFVVSRAAEMGLSELAALRSEASEAGWNGYGARPVDPDACLNAEAFLVALPTTAPAPEVSADADGDVALDWVFGPRKALSVSISKTGRCSYAWIRGRRTSHGTEWMDDEIPAKIILALGELAGDAGASW